MAASPFFEHGVEHRREVTGWAVNDLQYFGGRGFWCQGRVTLGSARDTLTLQIGYQYQPPPSPPDCSVRLDCSTEGLIRGRHEIVAIGSEEVSNFVPPALFQGKLHL